MCQAIMSASLLPIILGGVFSLIGGFMGSWLTRRTEYEKWLRQQRSNELSKLLFQIHQARLDASTAIYDDSIDKHTRHSNATRAFAEIRKYESVARIYMRPATRDELSNTINELWVRCTSDGGPANFATQIRAIELKIQKIIEDEIDAH